jgi:hypothetical protein
MASRAPASLVIAGALLLVLAFLGLAQDDARPAEVQIEGVIEDWLDATSDGDARAVYDTWDPNFRKLCSFDREEGYLEGILAGLLAGHADDARLELDELTQLLVVEAGPAAGRQAQAQLRLRWSDTGDESEGGLQFVKRGSGWYINNMAQDCHG